MAKIYVKIKGIHCQNCEISIQKVLLNLPHVKEVTIKNFIAHINYEEPLTNDEIINVYPQDKTNEIKSLQSKGKKVMMVGDGINDAPSFATADIGVTVTNATDIASNSSDVILLNDSLMSLVKLINISTKTLKIIKENLFWAFFYNIITIPIAMGLLTRFNITMNPMLGSFAMMLSSLTVILNALRLRK